MACVTRSASGASSRPASGPLVATPPAACSTADQENQPACEQEALREVAVSPCRATAANSAVVAEEAESEEAPVTHASVVAPAPAPAAEGISASVFFGDSVADEDEESPNNLLQEAVASGDLVALQRALDAGADPNYAGGDGSPIAYAAFTGNRDMCVMLISYGAVILPEHECVESAIAGGYVELAYLLGPLVRLKKWKARSGATATRRETTFMEPPSAAQPGPSTSSPPPRVRTVQPWELPSFSRSDSTALLKLKESPLARIDRIEVGTARVRQQEAQQSTSPTAEAAIGDWAFLGRRQKVIIEPPKAGRRASRPKQLRREGESATGNESRACDPEARTDVGGGRRRGQDPIPKDTPPRGVQQRGRWVRPEESAAEAQGSVLSSATRLRIQRRQRQAMREHSPTREHGQLAADMGQQGADEPTGSGKALAERLRELDEANDLNLLRPEEYEKARAALLANHAAGTDSRQVQHGRRATGNGRSRAPSLLARMTAEKQGSKHSSSALFELRRAQSESALTLSALHSAIDGRASDLVSSLGLKWKQTSRDPENRQKLVNSLLSEALRLGQTEFCRAEFDHFGVLGLNWDSCVEAGGVWFTPDIDARSLPDERSIEQKGLRIMPRHGRRSTSSGMSFGPIKREMDGRSRIGM
jgi:hypothetical protein